MHPPIPTLPSLLGHVPITDEAQAEARVLMLGANNILKPSDGKPIVTPGQDMVLGNYYITIEKAGLPGEGRVYKDVVKTS